MFKITNVTNTLYSNQLQPLNNKLKLTYCIFSLKTRIQILMSDIILPNKAYSNSISDTKTNTQS